MKTLSIIIDGIEHECVQERTKDIACKSCSLAKRCKASYNICLALGVVSERHNYAHFGYFKIKTNK